MDLRYEIHIFWSDEDGSYVAVAPEIPGCSAWGDTYEEALHQARVATRGHVKVAEKYGDPVSGSYASGRRASWASTARA